MDTFDSQPQLASHSSSTNDYDSAKDYDCNVISPAVQSHLKKVYATLCCALLASALGAYLHIIWNIGGVFTTVATLFFISTIFDDVLYEGRQGSEAAKVLFMMLIALFQGASIGPIIKLAITINPGIPVTAFVGTAIVFGCFSAAAMLARRRQYLYLGGMLSSGVSILLWVVFASSIFGGSFAFIFQVYFGLLVFVGYIVFDTQYMIEMANLGCFDYVLHALMLYINFIVVFVRILVIMMENEEERERRKRRSRRE